MAKFHINEAGNPGECGAQPGGCPFGKDAAHYDSPESARMAFESSRQGSYEPFCPACGLPGSDEICEECQQEEVERQELEILDQQQWEEYGRELYS